VKELPGSNGPSRRAAVMPVCQAGQPLTLVCSRQTVSSGAPMSISWQAVTGVAVDAGRRGHVHVSP
jgi:hypothetical protein